MACDQPDSLASARGQSGRGAKNGVGGRIRSQRHGPIGQAVQIDGDIGYMAREEGPVDCVAAPIGYSEGGLPGLYQY